MADIKEDVGAQLGEEGEQVQSSRPKRVASLDIFRGLTVAVSLIEYSRISS